MRPFHPIATAKLTSTTASQTLASCPRGTTLRVINKAANPVYLQWGAAAAIPDGTIADNAGVMVVDAGQTAQFTTQGANGNLSYIAETAGGPLIVSIGELGV